MIRLSECRACNSVTLNAKGDTCACGARFDRSRRLRNGARATASTLCRFRSASRPAPPPADGGFLRTPEEQRLGASCGVVRRKEDDRILVVWSSEHGAWALPGDTWRPGDANSLGTMYRALRQQCGVEIAEGSQIRSWPWDEWPMFASFEVSSFLGEPKEQASGRAVAWFTPAEFLVTKHPLQRLYAKMLSLAPVRRPR
jgi:ADP-ribose pyrophosphatase YjhB (NUDIX family)